MENTSPEVQKRAARQLKIYSIRHIVMGFLYLVLGGIILKMKYFGTIELSTTLSWALGGLVLVYGVFRIYRGYKDWQESKHYTPPSDKQGS